jgi:hypothetical protein
LRRRCFAQPSVLSAAAIITSPLRVALKAVFGGAPLCTGFRFFRLKQQALKVTSTSM